MTAAAVPILNAEALLHLAQHAHTADACSHCAALACPGWESMPGGFAREALQRVGTLRLADVEEPTLDEYHPNGTRTGSVNAPIAPAFFPYNRCEVWQCCTCQRAFLRYTEYGGYYEDERVRALNADLVVGG